MKSRVLCVISGFHREVDEKSARLGYHHSLRNNPEERSSWRGITTPRCVITQTTAVLKSRVRFWIVQYKNK